LLVENELNQLQTFSNSKSQIPICIFSVNIFENIIASQETAGSEPNSPDVLMTEF